jgi:hypothetical protein
MGFFNFSGESSILIKFNKLQCFRGNGKKISGLCGDLVANGPSGCFASYWLQLFIADFSSSSSRI